MKMKVGGIYSAHAFDENNERITGQGYYHFKLLYSLPRWHRTNASREEIFLGLKMDVAIRNDGWGDNQCFWFNSDGVYEDNYIRFELKRRLYNKTYYEPKR